jgi:hypothetical protein
MGCRFFGRARVSSQKMEIENPKGFLCWMNYLVKECILPAKCPNLTEKPLGFGVYPKILKRYGRDYTWIFRALAAG